MGLFKVTKTDANGTKTQCGGTVKTPAKAADLKARMRGQQKRGDSNIFSIDKA